MMVAILFLYPYLLLVLLIALGKKTLTVKKKNESCQRNSVKPFGGLP